MSRSALDSSVSTSSVTVVAWARGAPSRVAVTRTVTASTASSSMFTTDALSVNDVDTVSSSDSVITALLTV